jgi:hypothetical protein
MTDGSQVVRGKSMVDDSIGCCESPLHEGDCILVTNPSGLELIILAPPNLIGIYYLGGPIHQPSLLIIAGPPIWIGIDYSGPA